MYNVSLWSWVRQAAGMPAVRVLHFYVVGHRIVTQTDCSSSRIPNIGGLLPHMGQHVQLHRLGRWQGSDHHLRFPQNARGEEALLPLLLPNAHQGPAL